MLVLTRRMNERTLIWHLNEKEPLILSLVPYSSWHRDQRPVRLQLHGSSNYLILREEVYNRIKRENNGVEPDLKKAAYMLKNNIYQPNEGDGNE